MLYRENGQFKSSYAADQQLLPIAQDRWFVIGLIVFAYLAVPALASDYMFRALIIPFVILAIAAIGLNILVGYCGQISIGTAAFMAVGAYAAYNLTIRVESLNFLIVLVLAGGIAALVGALFGIPSLRIKGLYLAVATLAAQFFIDWLFARVKWFTNYSSSGSVSTAPIEMFGWTIDSPVDKYLFVLSIAIVLTLAAKNLVRGHIGRVLDGNARHGCRRRSDRHPAADRQAFGLCGQLVLRRRGRCTLGVCPPRRVGAVGVQYQPFTEPVVHDHHRRHGLVARRILRRGVHRPAADLVEPGAGLVRCADLDRAGVAPGVDDLRQPDRVLS